MENAARECPEVIEESGIPVAPNLSTLDEVCHWGVECALEFVELHCTGWRHVDIAGTTP